MTTPRHLFNLRATITRPTNSVDAGGAPTRTFATHLSNVACRVRTYGGGEGVRYGRENNRYSHAVYVGPGLDIVETDRVTVDGLTLDVQAVMNPDRMDVYTRLDCEETKP